MTARAGGLVLICSIASFFVGALIAFGIAGQREREKRLVVDPPKIVEKKIELCDGQPLANADYFGTDAFSNAATEYCRDQGYVLEEEREEPPSRYE